MTMVTPVHLAGGSGTRLWPLSRKSFPKQFLSLTGDTSLFQQSAERLNSFASYQFFSPYYDTNSDFRFIVSEQLQAVGIDPGPILIKPEAKNTGPAILAASLFAAYENEDSILVAAPSDHLIPDTAKYIKAIEMGINEAKNGNMVVFGIKPTHPETGFGYLELGSSSNTFSKPVKRFIEKPKKSTAEKMLRIGNYLWNAGIFIFKASDMINAFEKYHNKILKTVRLSLERGVSDLGFFRIDPGCWKSIDSISIDYAIMEKIENLIAIPFCTEWSDLGGWNSVWQETSKDQNGVALSGKAYAIDCKNSLIRSESDNQLVVGIGLDNVVAIAMPDAVLVSDREKSKEVKQLVSVLKADGFWQAENSPKITGLGVGSRASLCLKVSR